MSNSVATASILGADVTRRHRRYKLSVSFSAGDYTAGGIPLSFVPGTTTGLQNPKFIERPFPHKVPSHIGNIQLTNQPEGYKVTLVLGTILTAAVKFRIDQTGVGDNAVLGELSGAMPAALVAANVDVIQFVVEEAN